MRSCFPKLTISHGAKETAPLLSGNPQESTENCADHNLCLFPLRFESADTEAAYRIWRCQGQPTATWKVGLALLTVWCTCLVEAAGFKARFGGTVSTAWGCVGTGMGLLACMAVGTLGLASRRAMPHWLLQLGLLTAACNCTALALCTHMRDWDTPKSMSNRLDLLAVGGLLFSPAFPWRWAAAFSGLCLLMPLLSCAPALLFTAHGGVCTSTAAVPAAFVAALGLWPQVVGWGACVALAYDLELRDRGVYQMQEALKRLCLTKAVPVSAPAPAPHAAAAAPGGDGQSLPCAPDLATMLQPGPEFLPPSLAADAVSPPQDGTTPRSDGTFPPQLECRTGTLLLCRLGATKATPLPTVPSALQQQADVLLSEVTAAAAACRGDIFLVEADMVGVAWNLFRGRENHQLQATVCALRLQRQMKLRLSRPCRMVIVSAAFIAGSLGGMERQLRVVYGKHAQVARRLLHLSVPLKSKYVCCSCSCIFVCASECLIEEGSTTIVSVRHG